MELNTSRNGKDFLRTFHNEINTTITLNVTRYSTNKTNLIFRCFIKLVISNVKMLNSKWPHKSVFRF